MNHLTQAELQEFIDRVLGREELMLVEDHLRQCKECSERLASVKLVDVGVRSIPLESVSRNFTQRVMQSLRLNGGLLRQIAVNLLPLFGAVLVLVFIIGMLSGTEGNQTAAATETQKYVRSFQQTVSDALLSGTDALLKWAGALVGISAAIPSLRFIIGLALAFAAVALFDEFVFVPMMKKRG